ncbi:YceD family protein [Paenibacillus macerans]|uniref:YceD family protein n=1 Tax=Paenibacillus macerans TaxID=44252 RepID=UPI003D31B9D1
MFIYLRQVTSSEAPVEIHQALDVSRVVKGRKDITGISPLQVDLMAEASGGGVVDVKGQLAAELDMTCSRCLKPMKRAVQAEFAESFKQSDDPVADMQTQDEDEDLQYVADDKIDLAPYAEETLLLNLPFAAVCQESCKGLCPNCGTDLNEQECGCKTDVIDPRLAALGDFFKSKPVNNE